MSTIIPIHHEIFDQYFLKLIERASNELILQSDHDSMDPEVQHLYNFHARFLTPVLKHTHEMYVVLSIASSPKQLGDFTINFQEKIWIVDMIFIMANNRIHRLVRLNHDAVPYLPFSSVENSLLTKDEREFWLANKNKI